MRRTLLVLLNSAALMVAEFVSACGGGATLVNPPPPPPAALQLVLLPDSEDVVAAQALGWTNGIPLADVMLTPHDSSAPSRTGRSSGAGVVDFGTVPAGHYLIEASRWLSASERAQLPAGQDVNGWVARDHVTVQAGRETQRIQVPASHRRSLVISQWAFNDLYDPVVQTDYPFGGYLQLYNNADTTIYVDGMLIARGLYEDYEYPSWPCSTYDRYTHDPAGVWVFNFQAFPGRGRDYPVASGHWITVATDAIDHRPLFPGAIDLNHADFEFIGSADVDNPVVPNMVDVGWNKDVLGHGLIFPALGALTVVTSPLEVASLVTEQVPGNPPPLMARLPRDRILDVLAIAPNYDSGYPECPQTVDPVFDRAPFRGRSKDPVAEYQHAVARKAALLLPGGRKILQHTHTGDVDFYSAPRTPYQVP